MARSLDGLVLAPVSDQEPGQVGTRTRFAYREQDGTVWAEYTGGTSCAAISWAPARATGWTSAMCS